MRIVRVSDLLLLFLPSAVKVFVLRHLFGWKIGKGVRIGFSVINVRHCSIGDNARIGHFNVLSKIDTLNIGELAIIGHFNLILGGQRVCLGRGASIGRFNEINSILNPVVRGTPTPELTLGEGAVVTAWHKIDFTDAVVLEDSAVLAGRLSNIWTHNRQAVGPVRIGANCYVGSGIQMTPGSAVGARCVVGLGAIITKAMTDTDVVIAGVPAKVIKPIDGETLKLVTFPTRPDLEG